MFTFLMLLLILAAVSAGFYWREKRLAVALAVTVSACAVVAVWQTWSNSPCSYTAGSSPPAVAPPAPPQVPEDVEVRDFLKFHLAEGSQLLPVVTNPLVQPETMFSSVAYNPARDKAKLTAIDLSLYEGARLEVKVLTSGHVPINFRTGVKEHRLGCHLGSITAGRPFDVDSSDGCVTLLPGPERDPVNREMLVEFRVKPLANHSLWFKTERLTDGTPNLDPLRKSLPLGCVYWGRIPLVCNGKSLRRVVVQAEIPHPEKAGSLLTESDFQLMKPLALRLRGSSGQLDQDRTVSFNTVSQIRVATDEALLTDEYYDIYVFTDTNKPLLWRISVRCDWPPGT